MITPLKQPLVIGQTEEKERSEGKEQNDIPETMAAEADRVSNKQQREIPEAVLCSENDSGSGTCHHQRQAEPDDVYAPTTARSRAPRAPRPSDPRGPARPRPRRPGRCPPSLVPWPAARRDPPGRARQGGRRPPTRAVRHHHPDTLLNAADPGRGRAAEKPGEPRPRQSCAPECMGA